MFSSCVRNNTISTEFITAINNINIRFIFTISGNWHSFNNITFDTGGGYELSGEAVALQALQNMYQSASNAVAGNMRKNKARIKYNTIVYLINTGNE